MTRYKFLDELLSDRYHSYSLDDLTEEVNVELSELDPDSNGVVRRTIEKDIRYLELESPFLADIERYSVSAYNKEREKNVIKQCLRYHNPSFSIFKKDLSKDEEYLLSEALSLLGHFEGLPNLDALEGLRLGLGVRTNQKIIAFSKNVLENSALIGQLFTAISHQQVINIRYHRFCNKEMIFNTSLHPYLLKEYNHRWYLFAASERDGKLLCFGLERIDEVIPIPAHKYVKYEGDLNEQFDDIIGVTNFVNSKVEHIVFWVSNGSKDYIITKPIHDSQVLYHGDADKKYRKMYPTCESGAFLSIDCKDNYELIRELSSFGDDLIVLSPNTIQEEIYKKVSSMTEKYKIIMKG